MKPCDFCTMRGCFTPIAVCSVDFGLQARIARPARRSARDERREREHRPPSREQSRERAARRCAANPVGQRQPGGAAEQDVVDDRQRRSAIPAGTGGTRRSCRCRRTARAHRHDAERADRERAGRARRRRTRGRDQPVGDHAAMNAGSTITSRDSHDVRHIAAERQARSGRPEVEERGDQPGGEQQRARAPRPRSRTRAAGAARRPKHAEHGANRARGTGPARRRSAWSGR